MTDGTLDRNDPQNYKKSWSFTYVHELTHLDPVITKKEAWDPAYGSCGARTIAYQNRCSGPMNWIPTNRAFIGDPVSLNNADSYAFFGAASLFKYRLGIGGPATAKDTCNITNPNDDGDGYYSIWGGPNDTANEIHIEGILLPTDDRADGTYNYTVPIKPGSKTVLSATSSGEAKGPLEVVTTAIVKPFKSLFMLRKEALKLIALLEKLRSWTGQIRTFC